MYVPCNRFPYPEKHIIRKTYVPSLSRLLNKNNTYIVVIICYKGTPLAVTRAEDDDSLAEIRARMVHDEISLSFPFLFIFQTTGATIMQKQEETFMLLHCCYLQSESPLYFIDIINAAALDTSVFCLEPPKGEE